MLLAMKTTKYGFHVYKYGAHKDKNHPDPNANSKCGKYVKELEP
jgi:hypothetical protein